MRVEEGGQLGSWSGGLAGVAGVDFPEVPDPMPGGDGVGPLWAPGGSVSLDRIATHLLILVMVVSINLSPNGRDLPASLRQSMMELADTIIRMGQSDLLSFHDLVREGVVPAYIPSFNSSS